MGFTYKPLWKMLIDKDMKKKDLRENLGLHSITVAKMGKDEYVSMEVLDKLCNHFGVNLEGIVEHVPDKDE
ncbi:XRE family transcriptional regulator [Brevibacillus laterosporus]|uniref:XRE family transcriptional regulator n=1 Tax=Brevibacillus laterosporus TaxID=1465 RepID=A0A518VCY8_BRELA|nr:XRE family transcriptional regulator [Brevibacillus laterosporus]